MHIQVLLGLGIRNAALLDQAHSLKLELSRELPPLHDAPPVPSKHLTRCLRNRVQAKCSMSFAGSRFSSESAPRPFHHGIRGRGGTIFAAALPSIERQVQADLRTHLIHRPARDIFPLLSGTRVSSYRI